MDELRRKQAQMLFAEYNHELARIYEEIIAGFTNESDFGSMDFQSMLQNEVFNSMQSWFSKSIDGLEEGTPEGFFDSLLSLDDTMEVFLLAATMVDGDLPDPLMMRLGAFGEPATAKLLELALAGLWEKEVGQEDNDFRDSILPNMAALRVLGLWNIEAAIDPALDRFAAIPTPDEFIAEAMRDFLTAFGTPVVPRLISRLDAACESGVVGPDEYLLIALTQIGSDNQTEEIYQCMRRVFRAMEHKVIASVCLGDYGDGRAVPLLKGYLDRHIHEVDRQFFYETLSAIKKLGGDIRDIQDPFRDFNQKK